MKNGFFTKIFSTAVLVVFLLLSFCYYQVALRKIEFKSYPALVKVERGQDFSSILNSFISKTNYSYGDIVLIYAKLFGVTRNIHVGEYEYNSAHTWIDILKKLTDGDSKIRQFTIVEGWNIYNILEMLEEDENLTKELDYSKYNSTYDMLPTINKFYEGAFLPDTYFYSYPTSDLDILKTANLAMKKKLAEFKDCKAITKDSYNLLIIASLLEKEAVGYDEMSLVSGVIENRLKKDMYLGIDASVRYGVKNFNKPLKMSELRKIGPYNTYRRKGLPITPIANPSKQALDAACNPTSSDYFYYVLESTDVDQHKFSRTYKEHRQAVKIYRKSKQKK